MMRLKMWKVLLPALAVLMISGLACNLPILAPTTDNGAAATSTALAAQILTPGNEQLVITATAAAAVTPQPEQQNTPGGQGATCTYKVTFLDDVTVPDNSVIPAGQEFVKTWRVRNDGTCTWGPAGHNLHSIAFTSGDSLGAPAEVRLPSEVAPGQSVDVSVPMRAPTTPGRYRSSWLFRVDGDPSGVNWVGIGPNNDQVLYALIRVQ
jgi:hypothetical protein